MKKAAATASPVSLGTKRQCPKCAAKFYDFSKPEIVCPKCSTKIDPDALVKPFKITPEKKSKAAVKDDDEDEATPASGEAFESVEDIADDEDSEVVDIDVDDEEDEF